MSVLIAVPTRGSIQWATVARLQEIRDAAPGLDPILYEHGNVSVAQTRNKIVQKFLQGSWDALIMVDDDVVPPPHLLEMTEHLSYFGVLSIPHPMPSPGGYSLEFAVFNEADDGYHYATLYDGVHECDAVATGCVAIHRNVLTELGRIAFHVTDDPEDVLTGEDIRFCEDVHKLGYRIGYMMGKWYCDHNTTVSLAPLKERNLKERSLVR